MKIFLFLLLSAIPSSAASTITFWAFDALTSSSPYYQHYKVTTTNPEIVVASIDLYDDGWGITSTGKSSSHYMASVADQHANTGVARTVGWHFYQMSFDALTMTASLFVDNVNIRNGTYIDTPTNFQFFYHHRRNTHEVVIDEFKYYIDGNLVFQDNFDTTTLHPAWSIIRQDSNTYTVSGDTTNPRSGIGALAMGSTGFNSAAITLDLTAVPEPSTGLLGLASCLLLMKRSRPKNQRG
jgi:hypothetical protein